MTPRTFVLSVSALSVLAIGLQARGPAQAPQVQQKAHPANLDAVFATADDCMACHNNLRTPSGEDVSIGSNWRATMMANSARDPYWQAGVRRELIDHPSAAAEIQDECSVCHMPMARTVAHASGREGEVFAHLPVGSGDSLENQLAYDGVSCTICHQITDEKLGTADSFTGGYVVNIPAVPAGAKADARPIFGRFKIEKGLESVMHSSTRFRPTEAPHIRKSELCATCHTLITKALGPQGQVVGELAEQAMYLEWRHSAFVAEEKSCQTCHMRPVDEKMPVSSVLGEPREGMARHQFVGGNAFMLRMLNRYRHELGVTALPDELEASALRTVNNLQTSTAALSVDRAEIAGGRLNVDLTVQNLTGHKLPTAYPSRRSWIHLVVRDRTGRAVFESGRIGADGAIEGNDADADGSRFEPHYTEIRSPGDVQIYESVMGDTNGRPTTGLLQGVRYLKDNRLLPRGFDKTSADRNIAVVGAASADADFLGGSDRVRYSVEIAGREGPFTVAVELRFQSIAYRWAQNLKPYKAFEPERFVRYYESMAAGSSEVLAHLNASVR